MLMMDKRLIGSMLSFRTKYLNDTCELFKVGGQAWISYCLEGIWKQQD